MTEQEAVQQSVEQRQAPSSSHQTLMWPSIGRMPLNEFTTEGYFTCAFPTLFPTGAGDFLGQRQVPVTIGNYFKHLMQYDDGHFAWHHDFDSLLSTQRCDIVLFRLAKCMLSSTQEMVTCPNMSCVTWWEGRERLSPVEYYTMRLQSPWHQAVLAASAKSPPLHGRHTGSAHHLLHPQCSGPPMVSSQPQFEDCTCQGSH